jgi:hypothetical protein
MKRLHGWGLWVGALSLLLSMLLTARLASATTTRWYLTPAEIGDPDEPDGARWSGGGFNDLMRQIQVRLERMKSRPALQQPTVLRAPSSTPGPRARLTR